MLKLFADYHTHTVHSHGLGTVEENILAARARALEEVAITDHGPASAPWVRMPLRELAQVREEAKRCGEQYGIRALVGIEANLVGPNGEIDVPARFERDLDLLLVGFHPDAIPPSAAGAWLLLRNRLGRLSRGLARRMRTENTKALVEAVHRHPVDIVTHPGHRVSLDTAELARACAKNDTALEINSSHGLMTVDYCRMAAREGATFAIDSDAHRPGDVGRLDRGLALAAKAGLEAAQVINARKGTEKETPPASRISMRNGGPPAHGGQG